MMDFTSVNFASKGAAVLFVGRDLKLGNRSLL